jgi:16S rRNA (guanine527-N7)-methyltransferase
MSAISAPLVTEDLDPVDAAAFQRLTGCTDSQLADLKRFQVLLGEWNEVMNLVGPATMPTYWNRHAWDSAQLLKLAPDAKTWADLGAGAGLPGVVLAIVLKDTPGAKVHLIESMAKRCRFLRVVVDELKLPAEIHNARAEELDLKVDVVTARALRADGKTAGLCPALPQAWRDRLVPEGTRCRVRVGRSGHILEIRVGPAAIPERPARPDRASEGA